MSNKVTNLAQMRQAALVYQRQAAEEGRATADAIKKLDDRLENVITTDDVLSVTEILKIMEET